MSRLGGWVRWIGCAAVWEAGRAVCGERHLGQSQAYSPTATQDDGVGRGNIHTRFNPNTSQITTKYAPIAPFLYQMTVSASRLSRLLPLLTASRQQKAEQRDPNRE